MTRYVTAGRQGERFVEEVQADLACEGLVNMGQLHLMSLK